MLTNCSRHRTRGGLLQSHIQQLSHRSVPSPYVDFLHPRQALTRLGQKLFRHVHTCAIEQCDPMAAQRRRVDVCVDPLRQAVERVAIRPVIGVKSTLTLCGRGPVGVPQVVFTLKMDCAQRGLAQHALPTRLRFEQTYHPAICLRLIHGRKQTRHPQQRPDSVVGSTNQGRS